jgi:CPA2 family monovalent cation:H+ antiporter-2
VVRMHSEEEAARLEQEHAGTVFLGERELAEAMVRHVLERAAAQAAASPPAAH